MGYQLRIKGPTIIQVLVDPSDRRCGDQVSRPHQSCSRAGSSTSPATAVTVDRSSLHLHSSTLAAAACQHVTGDRDPTNTTVTVALDPNSLVKM